MIYGFLKKPASLALGVSRFTQHCSGMVATLIAFPVVCVILCLGMPPAALGATPTFTVANNIFASTQVGKSASQNVTVTVNTAVAIKSIALGSGFTEYKQGTISGCHVDGVTVNAIGTICSISVTFSPAAPGSVVSPALARNAPLLVTDMESGNPVTYAFGLMGAATVPVAHVTPGTISTYGGTPLAGTNALDNGLGLVAGSYGGDAGPAMSAQFAFYSTAGVVPGPVNGPQPLAFDSAGNLYAIDAGNYIIRKIDNSASHIVTTIAGTPKTAGVGGNGGAATSATLWAPHAITLDSAGNIYFLDDESEGSQYQVIRRIDAVSGIITAIAGQNYTGTYNSALGGGTCNGALDTPGYWVCGDGGQASYAALQAATNLAIDGAGNFYIWEQGAYLRKIDAVTGIINTIATSADFYSGGASAVGGMTLAADGNFYMPVNAGVYDYIEQFNPNTSAVTILAGGGTNSGSNCTVTTAQTGYPATALFIALEDGVVNSSGDLASDASGNIYLSGGICQSDGYTYEYPALWRINLTTQKAYLETVGEDYGTGVTEGQAAADYNAYFSYYIYPQSAIPDNIGNIYFTTYNQIALLSGSNAALDYGTLFDYKTSPAETATYANVGNASDPNPAYSFLDVVNFVDLSTGDAGACSAMTNIAQNATCNVDIAFSPTQVGPVSDTLNMAESESGIPSYGQTTDKQTVTLTGIGVAAPEITFAPAVINFGNQLVNTPSATQTITISNPGTGTLSFFGIFVSATGSNFGIFTISGGTCPTSGTLASGSSCTVLITFTPTATATYSAYLNINNTASPGDGALAATTLSGTGTNATTTVATPVISPISGTYNSNVTATITDSTPSSTIHYTTDGSTPTASSAVYSGSISISQSGTTVKAIATASGDTASAVASATYILQAATPVLSPPGGTYIGSQSVTLTTITTGAKIYYTTDGTTPANSSKLYSNPISVTQSATTIKAIAELAGYLPSQIASGTYTLQAPAVTLMPALLSFGNQLEATTSAAQTVLLTNSGTAPLSISAIALAGANPASFIESDNCVSTSPLAAKASCTITVKFSPASTATYAAFVTIADNATGPPQSIPLSGTGTAPVSGTPVASLTPGSLTFSSNTGTASAAQMATLTNTGDEPLSISSITLAGANPSDFGQTNTCGAALAAGASCTISVTFTPASTASFAAMLLVTDNATGSPQVTSLNGTGTAPILETPVASLAPDSLTFSSNTGASSTVQTATLRNTGNASLSISGISLVGANPGDFSQTNNCGSSLIAGANCTISVTFTPASATSFTATLSVADNAAGSPQTTALSGTGVTPAGDFSLSATPSSLTVSAGGAAKYNVAVAVMPSGDVFNNPVTLTATGLPIGAIATFSPATVTPGTGSASSTLTVQTAAAATTTTTARNRSGSEWPVVAPSMAFLFGGFTLIFWRRQHARALRKLSMILILAGLGIGSLAVMGCGGGFALPGQAASAKTYTITITGTAGTDAHSTTVTLTVN